MSDRSTRGRIASATRTSAGVQHQPISDLTRSQLAGTNPAYVNTLLAGGTLQGVHGAALTNAIRATQNMARNGGAPFGISVQIDLDRLAKALGDVNLQRSDVGLYRALNHTIEKFKTQLKRELVKWSGANRQKPVEQAMRVRHAGPGHLVAAVIVKDKWATITSANFGAKFRKGPGGGVSHSAWQGGNFERGAFMLPGKAPAFKHASHPSKHRGDLVPLYGPNYAREVERHEGQVRAWLRAFVEIDFYPRAIHETRREFERVKAKFGL